MLGIPLQAGQYDNAVRFPFEAAGQPGLDVSFKDEGSNTLTGSFHISDATFYKDDQGHYQVSSFAATFNQISDNGRSDITGSITYSSNLVPEPSSVVLLGISCAAAAAWLLRRKAE